MKTVVTVVTLCTVLVLKWLILQYQWRKVRKEAREKGYKLHLVSDDLYHAKRRPMPHGGMLYASSGYIHVRYEHISQERVLRFIEEKK